MKKLFKVICTLALAACLSTTALAEVYKMDYEVFVAPAYEAVGRFSDGLAAVKENGKWGYINEEGAVVIAPQYDYAAGFSEGKALVGTYGTYANSWDEFEVLYLGLVDLNGNYTPIRATDDSGAVVEYCTDDWFFYEREEGFRDGVYYEEKTELIGYAYHNGYLTIPGSTSGNNGDQNGGEVIIDKNGNCIDNEVSHRWNSGDNEYEETVYLGGVYSDGLFMTVPPMGLDTPAINFYTKDKEPVNSFTRWAHLANANYVFNEVYEFTDGYAGAWCTKLDAEGNYTDEYFFALVNRAGEIVFSGAYTSVWMYYMAETSGNRVISDGLIVLQDTQGMWGAVDTRGQLVIPFVNEEMYGASEGLFAVKRNGLWGYIDYANNMVIEPQYENATFFNQGIALITRGGVPAVIDRYNNVLEGADKVPLDYYITDTGMVRPVNETIVVQENDKYGFAKLTYNTALPKVEEMSAWAYPEVVEAIENNLVPMYLRNQYFENIDRGDFAQLIVAALEEVTGKDAEDLLLEKTGLTLSAAYDQNTFADTNDTNIIIANKLGIINGVSATSFAPSNAISRQDAATLLMRAAKLIRGDIETAGQAFADDANIADYAKQAVSYVTTLKIMNGVGENMFAPTATYTREQAYVTIVRLFRSLQ